MGFAALFRESLGFCKEDFLDPFHDAAHKFRELMERWNNRLTLEGQSIVEEYSRGRLTVVLDLAIPQPLQSVQSAALPSYNPVGHGRHALAVFNANSTDEGYSHYWQQNPMFVDDVQVVQGPQGVIPSKVRLYYAYDEINYGGRGLLYQSAINGAFKFFSTLPDRESSVTVVPFQSPKDNFIDRKIESRLQIMQNITNDDRQSGWRELNDFQLKLFFSASGSR